MQYLLTVTVGSDMLKLFAATETQARIGVYLLSYAPGIERVQLHDRNCKPFKLLVDTKPAAVVE